MERTPDQAKQYYVGLMGAELGVLYQELWQEIARLHSTWQEHNSLFGTSEERVVLLNQAAPRFFRVIQDCLWEETLLHISRLTDPPSIGKRANLTVQRLPSLIQDAALSRAVVDAIALALERSKFCRDWRNRRIAHADLALSLDQPAVPLHAASRAQVNEALRALVSVLNSVSQHFEQSESLFDTGPSYGGAEDLLEIIKYGLKARADRRQALLGGRKFQ